MKKLVLSIILISISSCFLSSLYADEEDYRGLYYLTGIVTASGDTSISVAVQEKEYQKRTFTFIIARNITKIHGKIKTGVKVTVAYRKTKGKRTAVVISVVEEPKKDDSVKNQFIPL